MSTFALHRDTYEEPVNRHTLHQGFHDSPDGSVLRTERHKTKPDRVTVYIQPKTGSTSKSGKGAPQAVAVTLSAGPGGVG